MSKFETTSAGVVPLAIGCELSIAAVYGDPMA